jgi:hypothetical protein
VSRKGTYCVCVKILINVSFVFRHHAVEHKVPGILRRLRYLLGVNQAVIATVEIELGHSGISFTHVCIIVKSDYRLHHVCPRGTTRIFMKFDI